tara:strand:+ start:173 stop:487 length:315 start_codon:yes stop_codon:yes gene_type:complete
MNKNLKAVPEGKKGKGLSKLPTEVRNNMGFMKRGGPVKQKPKLTAFSKARLREEALLNPEGKPFKGKIDTDKEKLVSENGKTMVVKKAKGGSIQVSGSNFSGVY